MCAQAMSVVLTEKGETKCNYDIPKIVKYPSFLLCCDFVGSAQDKHDNVNNFEVNEVYDYFMVWDF